jgi:predicted ATP-grasp superfamily ATP-dependent carboligase
MKKYNVLIYPAGTEIGLEINRALSYQRNINVIGANSTFDHSDFVYDNIIHDVPFVSSEHLFDTIQKIIIDHDIDLIFPAHDDALIQFSKWADYNTLGTATVVTSPHDTCYVCRSKTRTYNYLCKIIKTPQLYDSKQEITQYPVFLKPDAGQGSKNTFVVANAEELDFYYHKSEDYVISEYLPGDEYTVDCFTDKDGSLRYISARSRERISNGISVRSMAYTDSQIDDIAHKINNTLVFNGMWFFQLKRDKNGELTLLEIAPRVSGTMGFQRAMGVNLPLLSAYNSMGYNVEIFKNDYTLITDRALYTRCKIDYDFENVYVDYDDTIISNESVNSEVIGVLYRFQNQKKKIVLLTRHRCTYGESVLDSIVRCKLSPQLFDQIVEIDHDKKKSEFITSEKSIFIDDSFAERKEVAQSCHIPVFDVNEAIEIFRG